MSNWFERQLDRLNASAKKAKARVSKVGDHIIDGATESAKIVSDIGDEVYEAGKDGLSAVKNEVGKLLPKSQTKRKPKAKKRKSKSASVHKTSTRMRRANASTQTSSAPTPSLIPED